MTVDRGLTNVIFDRDGGRCRYCGDHAYCADHVVPKRAGGPDHPSNFVAACHLCNTIASDWVFQSWEDKRRYVLIKRFGMRAHAIEFRESVGAWRASDVA